MKRDFVFPVMLAIATFLSLTACDAFEKRTNVMTTPCGLANDPGVTWNEVQEITWKLLSIQGEPVLTGKNVTLTFGNDGQISGNAGANRLFGSFTATGQSLRIGEVSSTKMFRDEPPGLMDQEARYLDALRRVDGWIIHEGQLVLGAGEIVLLEFSRLR